MEPHQGEMTCLDCPPMKKPVRSVFVEGDRFIHHVLWQHLLHVQRLPQPAPRSLAVGAGCFSLGMVRKAAQADGAVVVSL